MTRAAGGRSAGGLEAILTTMQAVRVQAGAARRLTADLTL